MKLTAQIKIQADPQAHMDLFETMRAFNAACQFISEYAFKHAVFNKRNLQEILYYEVREQFDLPSQLAIRAFTKVGDAYKSQKSLLIKRLLAYEALSEKKRAQRKQPELKVCNFCDTGAVAYDARLLTYQADGAISLRTLRQRLVLPVCFPRDFDRDTIQGEADLVFKDNTFYLHQTIEVEATPEYTVSQFLGVDMGLVHIAYDSDGEAYDDPGIDKKRRRYEKQRASLKQKRTKNSPAPSQEDEPPTTNVSAEMSTTRSANDWFKSKGDWQRSIGGEPHRLL